MKKIILTALMFLPVLSYGQNYRAAYDNNNRYGFIGEYDDRWVIAPQYDYSSNFWNGFGIVELNDKKGVVDKSGKLVISCRYDDIDIQKTKSNDIVFIVKDANEKKGLADKNGKIIVSCTYDNIMLVEYLEGELRNIRQTDYLYIENNGKQGIIDKNGKIIVPCIYADVTYDKDEEFFEVENFQKLTGIVDKTGKLLISCNYSSIFFHEDHGIFYVEQEKGGQTFEGTISPEGKELVPCKYSFVSYDGEYDHFKVNIGGRKRTIGRGWIGGKWGLCDMWGTELIPCKYDQVTCFSEDLAAVNIGGYYDKDEEFTGGKWGYVNKKGEVVVPIEYTSAENFVNGAAKVKKDGKVFMLENPLKAGNIAAVQSTPKKDPNAPAVSRYPAPNSDVDKDIPQGKTKNENLFVFIIVNENYDENNNLSPVAFALNDGRVFKEYCQKTLGISNNNIKMFEDASLGKIIAAIEQVKSIADAYDGEAEVIIFYAGHGYSDNAQNAYLLPIDGNASDIATTGYSLKKFYGELSKLKLKKITVFLDACYSGAGRDGDMLIAARGVATKVKDEKPQGNMVVFSSATSDETAHPYEEKGHGLFTYFLLKKLQETQGNVTYEELSDYVNKQVKRQSVVINNKRQTPTVIPSATLGDKWMNLKLK